MKIKLLLLSGVILALGSTSCRSTKDITVMQDMAHEAFLTSLPGQAPEYRIKATGAVIY